MSQVFNNFKFWDRSPPKSDDTKTKDDYDKEVVERMNESIRLHDSGNAFVLDEDFQREYLKKLK